MFVVHIFGMLDCWHTCVWSVFDVHVSRLLGSTWIYKVEHAYSYGMYDVQECGMYDVQVYGMYDV